MFKYTKQPSEKIYGIEIDFSARMASSETLVSGTVTSELLEGEEGTGNDLVISSVTVNGTKLSCTAAGGYDGCSYKLTYKAIGQLNELESEVKLRIKET